MTDEKLYSNHRYMPYNLQLIHAHSNHRVCGNNQCGLRIPGR